MFSLHCRHGKCTGVSTLVEGMHEKREKKARRKERRNGRKKKEGERERKGRKGEKEREAQCIFIGGGKGIRVALKNTDESPVFKIPVRLRGFALREKGAEEREREREEEWGWWGSGLKGLLERRWRAKRKRGEGVERSESTDCRGDK